MTSSVQTSVFSDGISQSYGTRRSANNLFLAIVEDFDKDEHEFEIVAKDANDAASKAERLASNAYIQVYNISVYAY